MSQRRTHAVRRCTRALLARKRTRPLSFQGFAYRFSPYRCRGAAGRRDPGRGGPGRRGCRPDFPRL